MDGAIIRINSTLLEWLGLERTAVLGRRFPDLLTVGGRIYHETHYAPLLRMQGAVREIAVDFVTGDDRRLPTLINSVLQRDDLGNAVGIRTAVFDASDRRAYEEELLRARQRAELAEAAASQLSRTLQAALIPPDLPVTPGMTIAAAYRPAGLGDEVGGDFYDVFQLDDDTWGVAVGDVAGKGVEAAVVTALARHTIRSAAMRERSPSAVLAALNDALCTAAEPRICSAIFFRFRPLSDGSVDCVLSVGGHDLPQLLRSGSSVTDVGATGRLLGAWRETNVFDRHLVLRVGDVLVCYTDGVTEGRRLGEFFAPRLSDYLDSVRGASPTTVVSGLLEAAVEFQGGNTSDDIAILAIAPAET